MFETCTVFGIEFVRIPSPQGGYYGLIAKPSLVGVVKSFWLARTVLTYRQIKDVYPNDMPVVYEEVAAKISDSMPGEKCRLRLPTEFEWEWAALGGENFDYSGSNDVKAVGWTEGVMGENIHPVALKIPNGYGLYDMSGNVWEWTSSKLNEVNETVIVRGGDWRGSSVNAEVKKRSTQLKGTSGGKVGFRYVLEEE